MKKTLKCALKENEKFQVYSFDLKTYAPELQIRIPERENKLYLSSELNFARFYLRAILSKKRTNKNIKKIIYLDADTIVLGDIVELWESSLIRTPHAVAAVSRPSKKLCGVFLSCDLPEVRAVLNQKGIYNVDTDLDPFNAGVLIIDLQRWHSLNYTQEIEFWILQNSKIPIYDLFTNPPLMLTIRTHFEKLDPLWNCHQGSACWQEKNVSLLHWAGQNKPWHAHENNDIDQRWSIMLPSSNCTSSLYLPSPPNENYSFHNFVSTSSVLTENKNTLSPNLLEKKWTAQRKMIARREKALIFSLEQGRLANGALLNETQILRKDSDEFWRQRRILVLERMQSSVECCRKSKDALALVRSLVAAKKDHCHYVLVILLNGKMYLDLDQFSGNTTCGLIPPASLAQSLKLLENVVTTQAGNLVFLLCTAAAARDCEFDHIFSTSSSKINQDPVIFAYGSDTVKQINRSIVVVPGPPSAAMQKLDRCSDHALLFTEGDRREWQMRFHEIYQATKAMVVTEWATSRQPLATWRGSIRIPADCDDTDAWSRIETIALGQDFRDICKTVATRTSLPPDAEICVTRSRVSTPSLARRITKLMRRGILTARAPNGNLENYFNFRYLIMHPDTTGRDSLASAYWGCGAVVLRWDSSTSTDYDRWYEPALQDGITHINFTAASLPFIVRTLNENPEAAFALALNARDFYHQFFKFQAIQYFWSAVLTHYANFFDFSQLDHDTLRNELENNLGVHLRSISHLPSWFFPSPNSLVVGTTAADQDDTSADDDGNNQLHNQKKKRKESSGIHHHHQGGSNIKGRETTAADGGGDEIV
uniref:Uncharacterized protein n=1 Tax=Aureoumbra lagunensis TaxID=44058 RepID=A0A6S8EC87_9STRA